MTRWLAYERISDDPDDLQAGVGRQCRDTEAAIKARGGEVVEHLTENNTSAYRKQRVKVTDTVGNTYDGWRVVRPVWSEALHRLRSGEAKHLMVYDLDRLARDPRDLEDAIECVEHFGAEIRSATATEIDLHTESGRMTARMMVMIANKASADTGRRVARQKRQRAEDGMPQGGRYPTFGFTRSWEVVPEEAERLREAFRRRASGESVSSIARSIGLGHGTLVNILKNPIYCGLRRYKGEVVGELHPDFPRLVERRIWDAVQGVGEAPPAGTNARKYLLSGIARCGECSRKMKGAPSTGRAARYRCGATYGGCGAVSIRCDWIDDVIVYHAVAREVFLRRKDDDDVPDDDFTGEAEAARQDIKDLQKAVKDKTITMQTALPMLSEAEARLRDVERKQRQAAVRAVDPDWAYRDATGLMGLDLAQMRALIARHVSAVEIEKSPTVGRNAMDLSRVVIHWVDGEVERLSNAVPANSNQFENGSEPV